MKQNQGLPSKYRLSKYYIWVTAGSLIILSVYYIYKFNKYYDPNHIFEFNLLSLSIFFLSIVLMLLLLFKVNFKNKIAYLFLFFIIVSSTLISYDFIIPIIGSDCRGTDCKGSIMVAKRVREMGFLSFLENYNKPTLYQIKNSPTRHEKFLKYDNILNLGYKDLLIEIENESPDIVLSENTERSWLINYKISKHSPMFFFMIAFWQMFFNDSYVLYIILSNCAALLFLVSLYAFLGLFFTKEEYKSKLLILFLVMLLPIFLLLSGSLTNDLIIGVFITWLVFFLIKNNKENINRYDVLAGVMCSAAVLFKFTTLTLFLAIFFYYAIKFRLNKAIPKLIVVMLCFAVFPLLLYGIFDYDMILNIITGTIETSLDFTAREGSFISKILWYGIHEAYVFGIPFILLLLAHIFKIRQYLTRNEVLLSYLNIAFVCLVSISLWHAYWGRLLVGFLPFMIPPLVYIYKNCSEQKKMILSTYVLLFANNILILINDLIIAMIFNPYYGVN